MLSKGKLGFWGLTALVFGLVVGVGIFNLPQNMASVASPCAVLVSWIVTAAGILPLVMAFKWLSDHYPQYNAGIYQYAQAEFGNFVGFNIAWGYWLCSAFSNVAYAVILNDAVGAFFPSLLDHGFPTVIFGSVFIWLMFFVVTMGLRTAKFVNSLLALIKVIVIALIIIIFAIFFKLDLFEVDFFGIHDDLGSLAHQVKNTMMITLFCFFGVEGAVMMSARARRPSDVGRAGITGFILALVLYLAVSLLCYGLLSRAQLAGLHDPSIAYILRICCGHWAYWAIISAVIISLLGGWVAWTLVVAQVPFEAASVKILPSVFLRTNRHGMPAFGLFASSIVMELFLIMVAMADDVYLTSLRITGLMIIPCYFFTGLFMMRKAYSRAMKALAFIASAFCLWMAYAGGLLDMMMTSVFYIAGIGFYIKARREYSPLSPLFTTREKILLVILSIAAVITIVLLSSPDRY